MRYVTRELMVICTLFFVWLMIFFRIISVMDGSLPKKPCKTCKNRFHAGCLYKVRLPFSYGMVDFNTHSLVVPFESFVKVSFMPF